MRLSIEHHTHYRYDEVVRRSTQYLRLTPKPSTRQKVLSWQLDMPCAAEQITDGFGNILHVLTLDQPHTEISIRAHGEVEVQESEEEQGEDRLSPMVYQRFTPITRADAAIRAFAGQYRDIGGLAQMSADLLARMPFQTGRTSVSSTAAQAFKTGGGVCQDHTHVFLSCCRVLGLPARYVSGYLYTTDSSHVASHAWAEVWFDHRWHTFDVTNQAMAPERHLKLAVGLDYMDACPVRGVRYGGGPEALHTYALVERSEQLGQSQ